MPKRIDETPVRRRTDVSTGQEPSPGTPPQESGNRRTGVGIVRPVDIDVTKFSRRYKQILGVSSASPLDGYVSDLVPALVVGQFGPEDFFPDDSLAIAGAIAAQGGAGNASVIQIVPPGAGFFTIIDKLTVQRLNTAGEVDLFWSPSLTPVITLVPGIPKDARGGSRTAGQQSFGLQSKNTAAAIALPAAFVQLFTGAGANPAVLGPFVIVPIGDATAAGAILTLQPTTLNEALQVTIEGRVVKNVQQA